MRGVSCAAMLRPPLPLLALLALPIGATQDPPGKSEAPVELALVSELDLVHPGATFHVGLHFDLPEHFHVYWQNAGQSGMPTRAELSGPEGFAISGPAFPGPEKIVAPGNIVSYGYEDEAMLVFEVTAPERLEEGTALTFRARASWLVCKEACYLGDGEAKLELRAAPASAGEPERHLERLQPFFARLPRPIEALAGAKVSWEGAVETPLLRLVLPAEVALEYYPLDESALELVDPKDVTMDGGRMITRSFRFRPRKPGDLPRVKGVIGFGEDGARRFYEFDRNWPPKKREEGERSH